jgi:Fur family zinc uptake transcriptional regulator
MTDMPEAGLLDGLEAICRKRGGRMTRQRRAVLGKLVENRRPLSAYELRDLLQPEDASVTPASVYRCLDFLVEHGLVHRLETTRSFIACDHPEHPHAVQFLICRQCGSVVEAEDKRMEAATEDLGHRLGFALDQRTVELTGICGPCKSDIGKAGHSRTVPCA